MDTARPPGGSHPMESGSPRILPALANRTHFYHAVSGQLPATAQQCVEKTMNSHLDHLRLSAKTGLLAMIVDAIGLEFVHNTNINTKMLF